MNRTRFLLLFGLVLVLRIAIASGFRGNFDTQSFFIVVHAVETGQNVYAATDRYNYSPLWSYILTGVWRIAAPSPWNFVLLLGLLQTAADAASAALVVGIARRRLVMGPEAARRCGLLFFANPVSVLVSCAHGQFDGLSILFLLAALFLVSETASRGRKVAIAGMLALSLLVKHVTLFHPLLFSRRRERAGLPDSLVLAPYLVFAASFLPFLSAAGPILRNVVLYPGRLGGGVLQKAGGLSAFLEFGAFIPIGFSIVMLAGIAWVFHQIRHIELARSCLVLFLALMTLSPAFAVQYLVWPLALGALFPSAAYGLFTLAGALYHSSAPESLAILWPVRATSLGTWLAAAFWFITEMALVRRRGLASPDLVSAA